MKWKIKFYMNHGLNYDNAHQATSALGPEALWLKTSPSGIIIVVKPLVHK